MKDKKGFDKFQVLVHGASLLPLLWLIVDLLRGNLTINPIQEMTLRTGKYGLVLLILSLSCTPLNILFGWRSVLKARRPLGLYAFLYASIHFLIFIGLDYGLDLELITEAIFEKRFALIGFAAFLILIPLAITSTKGWMKRLRKNWKRLHRLVYIAAIFVIIHYAWAVKTDIREPMIYGTIVMALLLMRLNPVRKFFINFRRSIMSNYYASVLSRLKVLFHPKRRMP